jgi:hypothetical protein
MKVISEASAIALAAFLSLPAGARADISTMQMMEWCKPVVDATPLPDGNTRSVHTYESGLCWGAFIAMEALSGDYDVNTNASLIHVCHPMDGSTAQTVVQMVRIFDSYARQHPETQHQKFELTALSALWSVFPCKSIAR